MVKFMNTKERCLQCGEKLSEKQDITVNYDNDIHKFCNAYCLDQWQGANDDLK